LKLDISFGFTETYKNLSDFCWRIRESYWPDWDKCLDNASSANANDPANDNTANNNNNNNNNTLD
jgi:hypothetical protein